MSGTIKITADTTEADKKILNLRMNVSQINNAADASKQQIYDIARQGRTFTNLLISNLKQTTALQSLNMIQSNIYMGIQIKDIQLRALAALAKASAGNPLAYAEYAAYQSIAMMMGYNLGRGQILLMQQNQLMRHTDSINSQRQNYTM